MVKFFNPGYQEEVEGGRGGTSFFSFSEIWMKVFFSLFSFVFLVLTLEWSYSDFVNIVTSYYRVSQKNGD